MSDEQKIVFLEGRKTILRPFAKSDIPRLTRWINDPEVREFVANVRPWTEKQEEEWFDRLGTKDTDITLCIETKQGGADRLHGSASD